ncbi:MAG: hypothetical protein JWQ30_542 [Sediminibacterium sp.]|nr:hypothetical protein [Sediminibacterium sp.]
MRVLVISCFFITCLVTARAQDLYYVTVIRGTIKKEDRSVVKVGDKLPENAKLLFANKDCRLVLLHPQKGRFVLEADKKKEAPANEFALFLKNNLHLQSETLKLSSRGEIGVDEFFSGRKSDSMPLLFIGDTKFDLRHSGYLLDDLANNFFFLQYVAVDGQVLNNKLNIVHDSLVINENSFLAGENQSPGNKNVTLAYMKHYTSNRESRQIHTFKPVFLSERDCKKLLQTIKQTIGGSKEKIIEEAYTQLMYAYGKPYIETLSSLFDQL